MSRPLDLVARLAGTVVRVPVEQLSQAARDALVSLDGGAAMIERGEVSGALARDGRDVDVTPSVSRELARVLGDGYVSDFSFQARQAPPKPKREDFAGDEPAYFRAAAARHVQLQEWGMTE